MIKYCLYCGDKAFIKGYCSKHYKFLYRIKVDILNKELVNKLIEEHEKDRECLFCTNKYHSNGFCRADYNLLYSNGVDLSDTEVA